MKALLKRLLHFSRKPQSKGMDPVLQDTIHSLHNWSVSHFSADPLIVTETDEHGTHLLILIETPHFGQEESFLHELTELISSSNWNYHISITSPVLTSYPEILPDTLIKEDWRDYIKEAIPGVDVISHHFPNIHGVTTTKYLTEREVKRITKAFVQASNQLNRSLSYRIIYTLSKANHPTYSEELLQRFTRSHLSSF